MVVELHRHFLLVSLSPGTRSFSLIHWHIHIGIFHFTLRINEKLLHIYTMRELHFICLARYTDETIREEEHHAVLMP